MPKILITGNGFDLFHHLPTKYGHFMAIMETIEKYDFKKEVTFEDLFGGFFKERFLEDYNSIKNNYRTEDIAFKREKTLEISKLLITNSWYKHFKNVNEIDTWIDFELEISNILNQVAILFEMSLNSQNSKNFQIDNPNFYESFDAFEIFKKNGLWITMFENYYENRKNKIDEDKILKLLADSFADFTSIFNSYLSHIVGMFYENSKEILKLPINKIDSIFTFNYTPTIELLYKKENTIYLHGKIALNNNSSIIFGVEELNTIVEKNKGFEFLKSYQKIIKKSNFQIIHNNDYDEENIFLIFGHSLDSSDKQYILSLFNFIENDPNKKSRIIVFYNSLDDYKRKLANLFSYINQNRITGLEMDKRLEFIEINDQNLKLSFFITPWQKTFIF